jgi:5-oxoprolinase (ATP-hydrolysing)
VEIVVPADEKVELDTAVDPVRIAIFGNRFMSIAEQMGRTLQRTATSTNIKERLDFSCAIFGPAGDLIANAPHQPVHLGAMGEAVKAQMQIHSATMQAGDVWVSNHPAFGGSHLPDITVITPVIRQGRVIFFVANRGHHADVGGITPGSMPPFSKTLQDEGVVIRSFKLVAGGVFQEAGITELLQAKANLIGTRALGDNLSDLKAQVAANQKGIELLEELVEQNSLEVVQAYMNHLQDVAAQSVQSMLSDLSLARNLQAVDTLTAQDRLDDGSIIQLRLTLDRHAGKAVFDFSGTAGQLPNNMNTPKAVTQSAVIYCLRTLVQSEIPLNQGCLRSVKIILPEGSILSPSEDAAVVAGNVLTSQRITDVIFKAFKACAASQGCMNNLTFGNDEGIAYYETIGGGAGAGPCWHGQSGVHTHMTNTRITDPEILEKRYPVLLREFSIRDGSGGPGRFRGGDGLIREIEFLEPLHVAILSERRVIAPYGLEGGETGALGKNLLIKRDGTTTDLGGKNQFEAEPGDRIRILTPGGGGYGSQD